MEQFYLFQSILSSAGRVEDKVLVESNRFDGIQLPFLFQKVTVVGKKLPFFKV